MMIIDYVCIFIFTILSYLNPQFWDQTRTVYMLGKHSTTELRLYFMTYMFIALGI